MTYVYPYSYNYIFWIFVIGSPEVVFWVGARAQVLHVAEAALLRAWLVECPGRSPRVGRGDEEMGRGGGATVAA